GPRARKRRYSQRNDANLRLLFGGLLLTAAGPVARPSRLEHVTADSEEDDSSGNAKRIRGDPEKPEDVRAREPECDQGDDAGSNGESQRGRALPVIEVGSR